MPDNAAFTASDMLFRSINAEELVMTTRLFKAGIKDNKIVDQL